jgi:uncharacterized protein YgbK (DUF1537 family)
MIVVIADDLSGAAELAGVALRHGLSAEVQTEFVSDSKADVICLDTDSRSMPPARAARRIREIAAAIMEARPDWIYKKCDSALRGPILSEALSLAAVANKKRVKIISANPGRGRIIKEGEYFVNGTPLHETCFASDPEYPCRTSNVRILIGSDSPTVMAPDVSGVDDLEFYATRLKDDTLPVGAAEFFHELLKHHCGSSSANASHPLQADSSHQKTLLVCGSTATWQQRVTVAAAHGIPVVDLSHDVEMAVDRLRASSGIVIGIGEVYDQTAASLLHQLTTTVCEVLQRQPVSRMLLEGGATAAAIVRALDWRRLRACEPLLDGVGVLQPDEISAPTLYIKPGSYSWPPTVWPQPSML